MGIIIIFDENIQQLSFIRHFLFKALLLMACTLVVVA
jgi:hypothetical protein